ncbi:MAG: hypothetical protein UHG68_10880 [Clostridia bacterium]|nr:hypothetical protein [Clostridia bacterium]
MKKIALLLTLALLSLSLLCSCTEHNNEKNTEDQNGSVSQDQNGSTEQETPITEYLYGNWINEHGESEPIDKETVNGSPYTVKSIAKDEYGNIKAVLTVDGSEVTYIVYRYYVGYAEYSYMEALFSAKDITFKYSKQG